jgi:flagellar basal body-associated protein FliL
LAKKFFNQKVKKKRKKINSLYIIIGICVLFIIIAIIFIISLSSSKDHKNAVIQIRPTVTVELNSKSLDKTLFFTELSNVTEDDIKISQNYDLSTIGEYTIEIEVFNKKFTSTLEVVDTESPVVVTKDLTIAKGENYTASDFVNKCNDNSGDDCLIEFYTLGVDENAC